MKMKIAKKKKKRERERKKMKIAEYSQGIQVISSHEKGVRHI